MFSIFGIPSEAPQPRLTGHEIGTASELRYAEDGNGDGKWDTETIRWVEWRIAQVAPESRLRGEVALFWNPSARLPSKQWSTRTLQTVWHRACKAAGVGRISFSEGTRHSTLTALGEVLPERVLRAHSRHKSSRSLDHYSKPKARPDAIVRALQGSDTSR